MRVLCAWCLKNGKSPDEALIGDREPLSDESVSHGICPDHRKDAEDHADRIQKDVEDLKRKVDP